MTSIAVNHTQQLPLHSRHVEKGARLGAFGQWEVPLYYSSILEEHQAVRNAAGLFDISHMGEIAVEGPGAGAFLDFLLPRAISVMPDAKALYSPLLNENGGMCDDIIVYRFAEERFLLIVNAANIEKDFRWIRRVHENFVSTNDVPVTIENRSSQLGLLALQGPKSLEILEAAYPGAVKGIGYYQFRPWENGMIARTGYTGEDGYELMTAVERLDAVWQKLFEAGASRGLAPIGFGARDTLRLEAGMPLYGHDMNDARTPLEAGLGWAVDLSKKAFVGKTGLEEQKARGGYERLIGFEMVGRGIPREHCEIRQNGERSGEVTSGSFAPTLKKNIGMGYVREQAAAPGTKIEVVIREKAVEAAVVKLPFYRRKRV